jgi:hypothetical protein
MLVAAGGPGPKKGDVPYWLVGFVAGFATVRCWSGACDVARSICLSPRRGSLSRENVNLQNG